MAAAMGKTTRDSEPVEDIAQRWSKIKKGVQNSNKRSLAVWPWILEIKPKKALKIPPKKF
jgi:hypothetical protein